MPAHSDGKYCDALLALQEFCEKHDLSFRQEMIRLINARVTGSASVKPSPAEKPDTPRKKHSEESREKIRQSALARWARVRAAGGNHL